MFVNYLKSAWLNFARHKSYSLINIAGLVLGMASCILILLYVFDELNYDRFWQDAEHIYRYELEYRDAQGEYRHMRKAALRARNDLLASFPEIQEATRIIDYQGVLGHSGQEYFETVWFVDPAFPSVFSLDMLSGDATAALSDKAAILLSRSMADKYFGDDNAVGRIVTLDARHDYQVAGVFEDIPDNSHINFDLVVAYDQADPDFNFGYSDSWGAVEGYTYLKLAEGADGDQVSARLPAFLENNMPGFTIPEGSQFTDMLNPYLLRLTDIHLNAGGIGNIKPPGNGQILVTLSLIAVLVLVVACINFINLSTIRSLNRAGEISVRKAVGAQKHQIALQFLAESVLISLFALFIAMSLVEILLPLYNALLDRQIAVAYLSNTLLLTELVVIAILVGITSGILPAVRLSALLPGPLLTGGRIAATGGKIHWLQPMLVVLQFVISATLVLTTVAIFLQQAFLDDKDLGFSPDNKLVIRNLGEDFARASRDLLATELEGLPGVTATTFSVATPADLVGASFTRQVTVPGVQDAAMALYPKAVAPNFFETYGLELLSGRQFSEQLASDAFYWSEVSAVDDSMKTSSAILNQTAVSAIGFNSPDEAIGNTIVLGNMQLDIVGVVADFHFQSLREAITPNFYIYSPDEYESLTLAYADNTDVSQLVAAITTVWRNLVPGFPLAMEFVEANVEAQYARERLQFLLIAVFASLSIVIACMGLFALAAYSTRQRLREIGIRKVHGAQRRDIVGMFLFQFSKPVVFANLASWPLGFYAISLYLEGFEYRIGLSMPLFLVSGLLIMAVAWLAVIFHTMKAASQRPVLALKYE